MLQKDDILTHRATHKNTLTTNHLCKDVTQGHVETGIQIKNNELKPRVHYFYDPIQINRGANHNQRLK